MQKEILREDFETNSTSDYRSWFEEEAHRLELDLSYSHFADGTQASLQCETESLASAPVDGVSVWTQGDAKGPDDLQSVDNDSRQSPAPFASPSVPPEIPSAVSVIRAKLSQNPNIYFSNSEIKGQKDAFKFIVYEWIQEGKSNKEIIQTFRIIPKTLGNWRKKGIIRKKGAGRKPNPVIELPMMAWSLNYINQKGRMPQKREIKKEANKFIGSDFMDSKGWVDKFMERLLEKVESDTLA